jgi:hypothetical protein
MLSKHHPQGPAGSGNLVHIRDNSPNMFDTASEGEDTTFKHTQVDFNKDCYNSAIEEKNRI